MQLQLCSSGFLCGIFLCNDWIFFCLFPPIWVCYLYFVVNVFVVFISFAAMPLLVVFVDPSYLFCDNVFLLLSLCVASVCWCNNFLGLLMCRGTDEGSELPVNYNQECRKLQFSRGHSRWCSETVEDKQERMELKWFFPPDKKKNSNIYLISLSMFKNLALIMCLT